MGHPGPRWEAGSLPAVDAPAERATTERGDIGRAQPAERAELAVVGPEAPLVGEVMARGGFLLTRPEIRFEYASFFRRLGAFVLDEVAKTFLYLLILLFVASLTGGLPESASSGEIDPVALLPRLLLSVGYDWIFWSQGWTPGANAMGIRIVRPDGSPPGIGRGGIRALVAIPSSALFFIGYAWMLFTPRKQTWHDLAAGVYVVRVEDERRR